MQSQKNLMYQKIFMRRRFCGRFTTVNIKKQVITHLYSNIQNSHLFLGAEVSIWVFDKTELMKRKTNPITDKAIVEQIYQIMRKDMKLLREITSSNGNGGSITQYLEVLYIIFHNIH